MFKGVLQMTRRMCKWNETHDRSIYSTSCGHPSEKFRFSRNCPHCDKPIEYTGLMAFMNEREIKTRQAG